MKTINELRDYLLENYVNDIGDLDISCLDFSDFDGDVVLNGMKVKGSLHQDYQDVKGDLWQGNQKVGGDLTQSRQKVGGDLWQNGQKVDGTLWQGNQKVEGNLRQSYSTVKGNYYCVDVKVGGSINIDDPIELLKDITREELAKMGYRLKDE